MAYELYYTSAPRGLRPQTSGICTVGLTRGFPAPFIPRIEALSGYRKPSDDADSSACPIAFSHWIVEGGGVSRHVLSAVRMAPPDHTGRSNKFAHHLLLREEECVTAGPAWLLQQGGVTADSWTGEPRELPQERRMPIAGRVVAGICTSWQRAGGDAGWAGVLANAAMLDPAKACSVIVPRGTDALTLISEAMLLLPAELRWRVTFTSYFMEPIAGVRCSWRFCLDGTPAAAAARTGGGACIDLCTGAPCTRTGRFIDFARTGVMPTRTSAAEAQSGMEGHSSGGLALAPERPVDIDAVLGRTATVTSQPRSHVDDSARHEQRQHKTTVALAAAGAFFALLSITLLLLLMQSEKSAVTTPVSTTAPPTAPPKIPDSQAAPIQAVAQPPITRADTEVQRELMVARNRIADLESKNAYLEDRLAAANANAAPSTSVERGTPALTAAPPKSAMGHRVPVPPTVFVGWIVKSLPLAQKDQFGKWSGSDRLVECPEGAEWRWLGLEQRGGFGFDGQGITMRLARPGMQPVRIAELKCVDGWLTLTWTVTSDVDSSESGWIERLKREIEHVVLVVGEPAGISTKWICFSKPRSATIKAEASTEIPAQSSAQEAWQCAAANGVWSDVTSTLSISIPGCEQGGVVVIRPPNRGSADTRIFEVFFEWPADLSDTALTKVRDDILEIDEQLAVEKQKLALSGTGQDLDTRREREQLKGEIKRLETSLNAQGKHRTDIEERRSKIAQCVQGKTLLFGPKGGVPAIEFVLRIDRPTEVRK
jgi:hypothetical protein